MNEAAPQAATKPAPSASLPPAANGVEEPQSSGLKMAAIVVLCLLVVAGAVWLSRHHTATANKTGPGARPLELPPVPVVAAAVVQKDVPIYLNGIATVQAFNTVTVRARVDGQVTKIAFTEGQDVHAGDLLAQIDPDPYRASLDQAVAKKGQDEAQACQRAGGPETLRRPAGQRRRHPAAIRHAEGARGPVGRHSQRGPGGHRERQGPARLHHDYVSPIDGRTGIRLVDQGNIVHAADLNGIVVITQLRPISVVFLLPGKTLGPIQQACQRADPDLSVVAVSQDNTNVLGEGKLAVIDNQIDPTSAQIKLKATFPNTSLRLWPGQFVYARLLLTVRNGCVVVPDSVIQRGPEGGPSSGLSRTTKRSRLAP